MNNLMKIKFIRNTKISIKLTVVYALMFSMVLLVLNASILYGIKFYLYKQANKQIEDMHHIIINKVKIEKEQRLSSEDFFSDIPTKENIIIRIVNKNGKVINKSGDFRHYTKAIDRKISKASTSERYIELEGIEAHLIFKNIKYKSKKDGIVYFQIVKNMRGEYEFLLNVLKLMIKADFLGIIASIIVGYAVSRRMLRPIDYLTKTAENITANNLKERIYVSGPDDELKRLGTTFNNMIDRLQQAFNRQAQFVSDASHELRTPIAVIQGYANLLDRWGKDDRDALEKSIYGIKLEASNMASLVEKLLFLAKGDKETYLAERTEFWLNELIDEVVKETKIIEKDHIISCSKNDRAVIFADYKMIKQMLRIFIDNSIKYTPAEGIVDISSVLEEQRAIITVSDTGIGIPQDEIGNIFNRFYTVDKSRSKEKGGTGLGLSIARWIADMHNANIEVKSQEGKGTSVIVSLTLSR